MKLLIAIAVSTLLLLTAEKQIKKHSSLFYYGAAALSAVSYLIPRGILPGWLYQVLKDYITSGTLAAALFVIVMYAILLPKKSRVFKCFMALRGEIAILGTLLVLDHMVYYAVFLFRQAFVMKRVLAPVQAATAVIAVLLVILVVPLTVTSFKKIRRRMNPRRWKKLQRWSYLFYGLVYLHVAVVLYPKTAGSLLRALDLAVYSAVFGVYAALRIGKYLQKKKKERYRLPVWAAVAVIFAVGAASVLPGAVKSDSSGYPDKETEETDGSREASGEDEARTTEEGESGTQADEESASQTVPVGEGGDETERAQEGSYADGVWSGEGMGFNGTVKVEVTVENGVITAIKIAEREDDDPYFADARDGILPQIIEKQSADVDAVSGASYSSEGIIEAVKAALEQAAE